jgi:DNA-binding MarR family transcriptional regulator
MALEQEIQQSAFKSEGHKAVLNIIYTFHWVTEKLKVILAAEDVTLQQYNILRILRGSDPKPLSTLTIREKMLDKMSDTSRIVDRLLLKGLVEKKLCSKDKRLVDINITQEGKKLLSRIDERDPEMVAISQNLDQKEFKILNDLLDKLRDSI